MQGIRANVRASVLDVWRGCEHLRRRRGVQFLFLGGVSDLRSRRRACMHEMESGSEAKQQQRRGTAATQQHGDARMQLTEEVAARRIETAETK